VPHAGKASIRFDRAAKSDIRLCPPLLIEEEGVFNRATVTGSQLHIIGSDSLHGPVRELHRDNGQSNCMILVKTAARTSLMDLYHIYSVIERGALD
jgi:hypothetical protein